MVPINQASNFFPVALRNPNHDSTASHAAKHSWLNMSSDKKVSLLPVWLLQLFSWPTRSMDTDQDMLGTIAATKPHQSTVPIKS